jgi:hypothetical protein
MIEICRDHAANVKRWQDGKMVLRRIAAGMGEARKQFRRVNATYTWRAADHSRPDDRHRCHTDQGGCRLITPGPPPSSTASGTTSVLCAKRTEHRLA